MAWSFIWPAAVVNVEFSCLSLPNFRCLFSSFTDLGATCQIDCKTRLKCSVLVYCKTFDGMGLELFHHFVDRDLANFVLCVLILYFIDLVVFCLYVFFFSFMSLSDRCLCSRCVHLQRE